MLNNWMFGSEPVKIYSPLLSLDPLACQDGIRSQACGLMFARHSIPSAQEWPVSFPERAVFASGLQYLLDCYLWWLKVQIGLVDKGSPPTYSVHLRCTLALRLWVSFYLWMCWRSYTFDFFSHMVYKTKCQTLYFFFFFFNIARSAQRYGKREVDWGKKYFYSAFLTITMSGTISLNGC